MNWISSLAAKKGRHPLIYFEPFHLRFRIRLRGDVQGARFCLLFVSLGFSLANRAVGRLPALHCRSTAYCSGLSLFEHVEIQRH